MTIQFSRHGLAARPANAWKQDQASCVDLFKLKTIPGNNAYGHGSQSLMMSSSRTLVSRLRTFTFCVTKFFGKTGRDGADYVREK